MIYTRGRIRSSLRHLSQRFSKPNGATFCRLLATETSNHATSIDTKLECILKTEPSSKVFQFLVKNHARVDPRFSLTFTYNLLQQNNIQAAISLQHLLLTNDSYQIPNELWSVFLDKVCFESNYYGAMFVFHELIDNHLFYDEVSFAVQDNDEIPFIISPTILVHLGKIFTNNGDPKRMEGVLRYFRRFHSFVQDQVSYQSLLVLNVEANAESGDLNQALIEFRNLAYASRGLTRKSLLEILPRRADKFSRWRSANIKSNQYRLDFVPDYPLDIHQQLLSQICESGIYNPVIQYNVYPSSSQINPIIQEPIALADLPRFQTLITEYIEKEGIYDYHKLIQLMNSNHHSLHIFIIAALCDLEKHESAFAVLESLNFYGQRLCKSPGFITLLESTQNKPEFNTLRSDILKYYRRLNKGHVNYPVAGYI
ncbi:hypothetical protein I9W82_004290 [Candida metapsilosis]|uniref:Uncharacterized protein n=1 Tax=Candida metapsilosis TaxID=273372 RepID=A0A8H7ZFZ9_9ASCO|nr:hypothetical protein I9W82_004290 [Candida metapsilosis]